VIVRTRMRKRKRKRKHIYDFMGCFETEPIVWFSWEEFLDFAAGRFCLAGFEEQASKRRELLMGVLVRFGS
jgi:hypothetical protein